MLFLINMIISLLCVWLFTGKWEKSDRAMAFGMSYYFTPIIGIPLMKILSRFWY